MTQIALSALCVCATLVFQNLLFLETKSLVTLYECVAAAELYASLCLVYFSARLFLSRRRAKRGGKSVKPGRLFALCFWPALLYCAAVLLAVPFNALSLGTSAVILASWCASLALVLPSLSAKEAPAGENPLFSRRENEVVALVLQGKTTRETADALFISVATVKTHLQHIYEKAGVRNRAELARLMHGACGPDGPPPSG